MTEYPLVGMRAAEPAISLLGMARVREEWSRPQFTRVKDRACLPDKGICPVHTCVRLSRADRVCGTFFALPEKNLLDGALSPHRLRRVTAGSKGDICAIDITLTSAELGSRCSLVRLHRA